MKALLAAVALCISTAAAAFDLGTVITLVPDGVSVSCGGYRYCNSVPNDAEAEINVYSPQSAGPNPGNPITYISINGVIYSGQMLVPGNYSSFTGIVTAEDGSTGLLTVTWHSTSRRAGGGRVHYTITTWWLDSGSFTVY